MTRGQPVTGWAIRRTMDGRVFIAYGTFGRTRRIAWAQFLNGHIEGSEFYDTPKNRRLWRDRGTRPVRVILHEIGDGGCRA